MSQSPELDSNTPMSISDTSDTVEEIKQRMDDLSSLEGVDDESPPTEKKLNLSNPAQMDMIDRLRDLNIQQYVPLPQLVVVGDQSSGKSSVLEAVMEFPLSRDSGLCTRFATNITFHRSPKVKVSVAINPGPSCCPPRAEKLRNYKRDLPSLNNKTFLEVLDEATTHMGVLRKGENLVEGKKTFSDDVLKIEISGPDRENLSIIDIPGIFRNVTEGVTTEEDIEMVNNMVRSYIKDEGTIILAVVPANVDIATQEILRMAEDADPKGERTLGVLTKPDIVDKGGEQNVIDLVNGQKRKLALGYCIVRNRGQNELSITSAARARKERAFFLTEPWNTIDNDRVGIESLKSRLQILLAEIIRREFPKIKARIDKRLQETNSLLERLGSDRDSTEQQRKFLEEVAMKFQKIRDDAMETQYHKHQVLRTNKCLRLPTLVADRCDLFLQEIVRYGHAVQFHHDVVIEGDQDDGNKPKDDEVHDVAEIELKHKRIPGYDELDNLLTTPAIQPPPEQREIKKWIEDEYRASRGYDLEVMDPSILPLLWQTQSQNWDFITRNFINDIIAYVHRFFCTLLVDVCPDPRTREALLARLMDDILPKYRRAIEHVKFILKVERLGTMITKNHYFADTLAKIRGQRREKELKGMAVNGREWHASYASTSDTEPLVRLSDLTKGKTYSSNLEQAVEDLHDLLLVYYKVARKRFVDTIISQAADYFLLTGDASPLNLLTPPFISSMTAEQLEQIAGEDMASKNKRAELKKQIAALEEGKKVLRG